MELKESTAHAPDWRSRFQMSPTVFLAAALGGGLLIGMATRGRKTPPPAKADAGDGAAEPARPSWDWNDSIGVVKSVLIGIAITQVKKMLFNPAADRRTTPADGHHRPKASAAS
jgi:hypothetical protein